jgi:hypothetical protein
MSVHWTQKILEILHFVQDDTRSRVQGDMELALEED